MTRRRRATAGALVLVLLGGLAVGVAALAGGAQLLPTRASCVASVDGHDVTLDPEQAAHAADVVATAVQRELPARAATIALAAAYQESDLRNLDYGDRDSVGLFQQRPSQGWGTRAQILDPAYATAKFYDALVRVPEYRDLPVTVAAQEVQRSAFPNAYADHEQDARVLASAFTGWSPAAFSCTVRAGPQAAQAAPITESGLTVRAAAALAAIRSTFGPLPVGGFDPAGVSSGHMAGSAHYDGRAIDVFFRPVTDDATRHGWALAQWAVANADRLGVTTVIYDGRLWTAARSAAGWRTYDPPGGPTDNPTLLHIDHVHVDVR